MEGTANPIGEFVEEFDETEDVTIEEEDTIVVVSADSFDAKEIHVVETHEGNLDVRPVGGTMGERMEVSPSQAVKIVNRFIED